MERIISNKKYGSDLNVKRGWILSVNKSSGRKLGSLVGELVFMADDFDETPDCFKEYM